MNDREIFKMQVDSLLGLMADVHKRMATNRDPHYRAVQQQKIDGWQEELTKLQEGNVGLWIQTQ